MNIATAPIASNMMTIPIQTSRSDSGYVAQISGMIL